MQKTNYLLLSTLFFCCLSNGAEPEKPTCNKEEFLKEDYLAKYNITRQDIAPLAWTYDQINKAAGLLEFVRCQNRAKAQAGYKEWKQKWDAQQQQTQQKWNENWDKKELAKAQEEFEKIKEYKGKVWSKNEEDYDHGQRHDVLSKYHACQNNLFRVQHKNLVKTPEFAELSSAHWLYTNYKEDLFDCERQNASSLPWFPQTDRCSRYRKQFENALKRKERAIKDFEQLPEVQEKNIKNPFVD